jgi:hypothetical protein
MKRGFIWSLYGLLFTVLLAMATCSGGGGGPQDPAGWGFFYAMMFAPFIMFAFFVMGLFVELVIRFYNRDTNAVPVEPTVDQRADKLVTCPSCGNTETVNAAVAHLAESYHSFNAKDSWFFTSMVFICNNCSHKFRD